MNVKVGRDVLGLTPTSALGVLKRHAASMLTVAGTLSISSTSADEPNRYWPDMRTAPPPTSGGWHDAHRVSSPLRRNSIPSDASARAILEIRRITGLTWDQLARVFDVSRRAVHAWASGGPLRPSNQEKLNRTLEIARALPREDAAGARTLLFTPVGATIPFDLLVQGRLVELRALLDLGRAIEPRKRTPLDDAAIEARRPIPPVDLLDALQDRAHRDIGRGRAARTLRNKRRGRD